MESLATTPLHRTVTLSRVGGQRSFRRRLMELGLVPGTPIQVINVSPMGDPLELRVRECHLSIRRNEAQHVFVQP